jgi:hypothetical protein
MDVPRDIYDRVFDLATALTEARERTDTRRGWALYSELKGYCEAQERAGVAHPFLWETLADYTDDDTVATALYMKALKQAQAPARAAYRASIQFALAERHKTLGNSDLAYKYALAANEEAKGLDDLELRRSISEFLLSEAKHT